MNNQWFSFFVCSPPSRTPIMYFISIYSTRNHLNISTPISFKSYQIDIISFKSYFKYLHGQYYSHFDYLGIFLFSFLLFLVLHATKQRIF